MKPAQRAAPQLPRSAARLAAVQAIYEMEVSGADADSILDNFLRQRWPWSGAMETLPPPDLELLTRLIHGVEAMTPDLDCAIDAVLRARQGTLRIELLLRAILRAGAYELSSMQETPAKVIINEYINLGHAFYSSGEPALVNAVLDRLAARYRDDLAADS